jgi:hypothetical protein
VFALPLGKYESKEMLFFDNVTPTAKSWSSSFKRDRILLSYRMKDDLKSSLIAWQNIL